MKFYKSWELEASCEYFRVPFLGGGAIKEGGGLTFFQIEEKGVMIKRRVVNDEKSWDLPLNYANPDKLGQFCKIMGSQNIIFMKWGEADIKRDVMVKNPIFGK